MSTIRATMTTAATATTDTLDTATITRHSSPATLGAKLRHGTWGSSTVARDLAILVPVGEIDASGARRDGLDAFLDKKLEEGYVIETRTHTHAIISRRPKGFRRFTSGADPGRYVVEVDEDGIATMSPAEPRRT